MTRVLVTFIGLLALCSTAHAGSSVMVSDFRAQGLPDSLAQTVTDLMVFELSRTEKMGVMGDSDIVAALDHQAKQSLLGCDENCLVDMARQLACTHLLHGSVGKLGEQVVMNLTLLRSEDGGVVGRISQVLFGSGEQWLPALQFSASEVASMVVVPAADEHENHELLMGELESLRTAQRPKTWNLNLSTGIGSFFSGLEDAGLNQPLFLLQLSYDYSIETWFLLGFELGAFLNKGTSPGILTVSQNETGEDSVLRDEKESLLKGYYGAARAVFRKSTGLWLPYAGFSAGAGYMKVSLDDGATAGENTSAFSFMRAGSASVGFMLKGFTGSQFMISNELALDVQLTVFQYMSQLSFQVTREDRPDVPLYEGSFANIRGTILMLGLVWQN